MRLWTGQHKETKWLHCLQSPTIHYEKDKDISPSARDPLLPNKQFPCWNYSSCSNLFIVRDRMTSSTLQNTKSTRCFQEIRHQRASWTQPGISCNTTFTNCPRICGDFHYSDIPLLLWKSKKYPAKIWKTLPSQLKSISLYHLQMFKDLTPTVQNNAHKESLQKNSDQNYNERIIDRQNSLF